MSDSKDPDEPRCGDDSVMWTERIGSFTVTLTLISICVAIFWDGYVEVYDSLHFVRTPDRDIAWERLGINGTAQALELGLRSYCVIPKQSVVIADSGVPAGRVCEWYGQGAIESTFGTASDDHKLQGVFGNETISAMNAVLWVLWLSFLFGFIGALFSEQKCCNLTWGAFLVIGGAAPIAVGMVYIKVLEEDIAEDGGSADVEYIGSFWACVCAICFAGITVLAGAFACAVGEKSDKTNGSSSYMNENIEIIGRVGAALGQIGWILYLSAMLDGRWVVTDQLGSDYLSQFGLGNATEASFGLQEWCTRGLDLKDAMTSAEVHFEGRLCYKTNENLGAYAMDICDVLSDTKICDNMNIAMLAVVIGFVIGILADFFSDKMKIVSWLQFIAAVCGIIACVINSQSYSGGNLNDIIGDEAAPGNAVYILIGGIVAFIFGGISCLFDAMDICRPENFAEGSCIQKCCVCGQSGSADISEIEG